MLGPDVGAAKTILQASANAVATVTNYAQATLTAVPRIDNPPDWYAPIGADLVAAQGHAKGWIDAICPAVTTGLPNSISSFNDLFQSSTRQILALQDAIVADGGTPSADQRSSVDTLIGALSSAFAAQQANTNVIGQEVTGYPDCHPCQRAAPAVDRRHEHAAFQPRDAAQLHPRRRALRHVPGASSRYGDL